MKAPVCLKFVYWSWVNTRSRYRTLKTSCGWNTRIYALVDPLDGTVRYVGKTSKTLDERLEEHLAVQCNLRLRAWLLQLAAHGAVPQIRLLTYAPDRDWERFEASWIRWFAARGDLYNRDGGGLVRKQRGTTTAGKVRNFLLAKERKKALGKKPDFEKAAARRYYGRIKHGLDPLTGGARRLTAEEIATSDFTPPRKIRR